MQLIAKLQKLNRCHISDEMQEAYALLASNYPKAEVIQFKNKKISNWQLPPSWQCISAVLREVNGKIIADINENNLRVFAYSPSIEKTVDFEELDEHLISDPERPDAICFHFRNQYRHWDLQWGFSLKHTERLKLDKRSKYEIKIKSNFKQDCKLTQCVYKHQGYEKESYIFIGHFDHTEQVNDGLAGCIVAYEIIKRLNDVKTHYTYKAFASVEIVGSMFYLDDVRSESKHIKEGLFFGFSGIESDLVYQTSFKKESKIDRIVRLMMITHKMKTSSIYDHREIIGNDENVFDSPSYGIPTSTLMRWPFPQYHTHKDDLNITSKEKIEEQIQWGLSIVFAIENNYIIKGLYQGIPCLAHPDINLYLNTPRVSNIKTSAGAVVDICLRGLDDKEKEYIATYPALLNTFMQKVVRLVDGSNSLLDIAEETKMPFRFVLNYIRQMEDKNLVIIGELQ